MNGHADRPTDRQTSKTPDSNHPYALKVTTYCYSSENWTIYVVAAAEAAQPAQTNYWNPFHISERNLTEHFTIFEPQNPVIIDFMLSKKRWRSSKIVKCSVGKTERQKKKGKKSNNNNNSNNNNLQGEEGDEYDSLSFGCHQFQNTITFQGRGREREKKGWICERAFRLERV